MNFDHQENLTHFTVTSGKGNFREFEKFHRCLKKTLILHKTKDFTFIKLKIDVKL